MGSVMPETLSRQALSVDLERNTLHRNGLEVRVSPREAEIAAILLERQITSLDRLLIRVYGQTDTVAEIRTMHVFLSRLRPALRSLGCRIVHFRDRGYELIQDEPSHIGVPLPAMMLAELDATAAAVGVGRAEIVERLLWAGLAQAGVPVMNKQETSG